MASYNIHGDELVTCPYDPVHRLKRSRMQMHLVKCARNHPNLILKECPFNSIHRFEEHEFQHHLLNCPERHKVDRMVGVTIDRNNPFKGHTGVPSYSTPPDLPEPIESWENEISSVPVAGYVPPTEVPKGGIIHDMGLTTPSERKLIYQKLSLANEEKTNDVVRIPGLSPIKAPVKDSEPRKPKQRYEEAFRASMLQNGHSGEQKADSRIAADIFSAQSTNNITRGMQNLGIGRGRGNPGLACLKNYENDFPALGLGRGSRVQK